MTGEARYHALITDLDRINHRRADRARYLFNDAGERIVETPEDAIRTYLNTDLDYLYVGNLLVSRADRKLHEQHPRNTGHIVTHPAHAH